MHKPVIANHNLPPMGGSGTNDFPKPPLNLPKPRRRTNKNYEPTEWKEYFDDLIYMDNGTPIFHTEGEGPIFLCFHGAGMCALSFALVAKEVKKFARLAAFDFRGHGFSKHEAGEKDLSIDTLVNDGIEVVRFVQEQFPKSTIVLMGHSMGGSVACKVSKKLENQPEGERVIGLIVIDVVEGSAIEALPHMETILNNRPKKFSSLEDVVRYNYQSRTVRKLESARVSCPP